MITVKSAVLDRTHLTLYLEDGSSITVPQTHKKIADILNDVITQINAKGFAEITLDEELDYYKQVQKKTSGLIKFLKASKDKVKNLLSFGSKNDDDDVVIAKVEDTEIPNVQNIAKHIEKAVETDNIDGIALFLKRLGAIIHTRQHSVQDLLTFMKRADLPITKDGSIIAYKILTKAEDGTYVDGYTEEVKQWVGAKVCMDESLVDPNRHTECSNGLHIARRDYIGSFYGNVCVIVKVNPEDVIAVPHADSRKMRVMAYHILHELTQEEYSLLKKNDPITKFSDSKVLANILMGNHIGVTDIVKINGQMGTNITYTKVGKAAKVILKNKTAKAISDDPKKVDTTVEPAEVLKKIKAMPKMKAVAKNKPPKATDVVPTPKTKPQSLVERIKDMPIKTKEDALAILALKKKAKKGWSALGIDTVTAARIETLAK